MSGSANTIFLRAFYLVIYLFIFLYEQTKKNKSGNTNSHIAVMWPVIWGGGKTDSLVAVSGYTLLFYPGWSYEKMCVSYMPHQCAAMAGGECWCWDLALCYVPDWSGGCLIGGYILLFCSLFPLLWNLEPSLPSSCSLLPLKSRCTDAGTVPCPVFPLPYLFLHCFLQLSFPI